MSLYSEIQSKAESIWGEVRRIRRYIHQYPELSFQEHKTMAFLSDELDAIGVNYQKGIAGTGLVVEIEGRLPGPCIALRADLDALPIQEENRVDYCSTNPGVMHACGHDVHSACLMGALMILSQMKDRIQGKRRFIFQPGEEKLPGGASLMIKEGVLEGVDQIIALHVFPDLQAGQLGFKEGMYMASADEVYLSIQGRGGHGAIPHKNIDPVIIAAETLLSLQQIVSRKAPAQVPSVLSFGRVIADGVTNVIPDTVEIAGTFRTMDEEWRAEAHGLIHSISEGIAKAHGASCTVEVKKGYPFLKNNEDLTKNCSEAAKRYLGSENVHELPLRMTGEDFAFYSHQVPGCFFRLGTASPEGRFKHSVHSSRFDIDEQALKTGSGILAYLALELKS